MKDLSEKQQKLLRLALNRGAKPGEIDNSAIKFVESLRKEGKTFEDIFGRDGNGTVATPEEPVPEPEQCAHQPFRLSLKDRFVLAFGFPWVVCGFLAVILPNSLILPLMAVGIFWTTRNLTGFFKKASFKDVLKDLFK